MRPKRFTIVMIGAGGDPVEAGFIESLARPGGNVTGITNLNRELGGKRLELHKKPFPKVKRNYKVIIRWMKTMSRTLLLLCCLTLRLAEAAESADR